MIEYKQLSLIIILSFEKFNKIMNDKSHPYHVKGHPDHDKSVQQLLTLREMLNAK